MSLRILQIMNRVPWPLKDGGALGFFNYTKGYALAGCEVTTCALNTNKHYIDLHSLPDEVKKLADWRDVRINTDVNPLDALKNLFTSESYNIQRFYSTEFEKLLVSVLNEKAFDVIVFESIFVSSYDEIVRKHSNALCVLRQHNVEYHIWETLAQNESNPIKRIYLRFLAGRMKLAETRQINRFDALTTVTQEDADVFRNMGCEKPIFVSPFGIDMQRLKPDHSHIQPYSVFHLGSMEWLPNQQAIHWFMQEVWSKVVAQVPEAKFYLAGRAMPESFDTYRSDNVILVGEVEDAIRFMQEKQIMIVPLFAGSGIRVKILEGMALGKAIVSTSLGARGIDCEAGKHLLVADDADGFAAALVDLLKNQDKTARLSEEACKLASSIYDNTKVIDRVLSFYKSLLNK